MAPISIERSSTSEPDINSFIHGWVSQPNQRGTSDIIWSCLSTLSICLWVQLHLNVPAIGEGFFSRFWRRLRWLVMGVVTPEILLLMAGGQWASAKRSVADMKELGHGEWTLVHGFYADSGGFMLHAPDTPPFPASAKQIHYLVRNCFITKPKITREEIFDKSKGDIFAKTLACFQTLWFFTQCITRYIEHLHVSPLELQTGAIILCTFNTYLLWLYKPLDVNTPTMITMEESIASVLTRAGPAAKEPYRYTPLDFVEPQAHIMTLWPRFCRHYGPFKKPLRRIPNDRNPRLVESCQGNLETLLQRAYFGVIVICFSTSSFAEWHFPFPSSTERLLWRYSCLIAESSLFVHAVSESVGNRRLRKANRGYGYIEGYKLQWPAGVLFFWVPFVVYVFARTIILGVAVSSLRGLPGDCYLMVSWPNLIPYIT